MPALRVLGRRWFIGSDDLVYPFLICVFVRLAWVTILTFSLTTFIRSDSDASTKCSHPSLVLSYLANAIAFMVVVLITEVIGLLISARGGIMQVEKRKHVPTIVHFRFALFLLEILLCVLGTYWWFVESSCPSATAIPVHLVIVSNWILVTCTVAGIITVFDPFGGHLADHSMNDKLWEKRFSCVFCCIGREQTHGAFEDLAQIFAPQFQGIDLVGTDIAVGLMLVAQQQKIAVEKQKLLRDGCSLAEIQCQQFDTSVRENRELLRELSYYSSYALASYGWPMFMYLHPFTGWFNLCQECSVLDGSGVCQSNHIALKKLSGLEDNDIIFSNFSSNVYSPSFYVAVDHERQKIILTVRGTLSLQDVITDMVCDTEVIPGYPEDFLAHKGMLISARNIRDACLENNVLNRAYERYPDYSLLVLGHSLGAGTAAILSFLLLPEYPHLQCFAYGPPGGLLSVPAVEKSREFVFSTVVDVEFSTRLSLNSIQELRDAVLRAIQCNSKPKWKLTLTQVAGLFKGNEDEELPLIQGCSNGQILPSGETRLFPPGKVVFLKRTEDQTQGCCDQYNQSNFEILSAPNTIFDHVVVQPQMLTDHLPDTLVKLLRGIRLPESETLI